MKKQGYYSSGEFAHLAQVTVRTIRFYDKQNILKPSFVDEKGNRFYTDSDLARLQQIVLLKYLGFSLEDIREMTIDDSDYHFMLSSLKLQKKLVQDRIEQMQLVEQAIDNTVDMIEAHHSIDWSQMLNLIHLTGMESTLKVQYQNANNISARIRLHEKYSVNKQGWFPWVYEQMHDAWHSSLCPSSSSAPASPTSLTSSSSASLASLTPSSTTAVSSALSSSLDSTRSVSILELGCGNGALWLQNKVRLPANIDITLSDISEGMIREARRDFEPDKRFHFAVFDCHSIPFDTESFDIIIANHVLFYCENTGKVCSEIARVLKPNGIFICSTYGVNHMKEITQLVKGFDDRIVLSKNNLYENFGLENGTDILSKSFSSVKQRRYDDEIIINSSEPLIEYILSCHGNQNQYILDRYHDFRNYIDRRIDDEFHITKDAGIFLCRK